MALIKVWLPLILSAMATAAASFSTEAQAFILAFASQHIDWAIYLMGAWAVIAHLLPSPAAFQKLIDEAKAKQAAAAPAAPAEAPAEAPKPEGPAA